MKYKRCGKPRNLDDNKYIDLTLNLLEIFAVEARGSAREATDTARFYGTAIDRTRKQAKFWAPHHVVAGVKAVGNDSLDSNESRKAPAHDVLNRK